MYLLRVKAASKQDDVTQSEDTLGQSDSSSSDSGPETLLDVLKNNFVENITTIKEKVTRLFEKNFPTHQKLDDDKSRGFPMVEPTSEDDESRYTGAMDTAVLSYVIQEAGRRQEAETAKERVRKVFVKDPITGELSPELRIYRSWVLKGTMAGCLLGFLGGRKQAKEEWMRRNMATKFTSQMGANRKLYDWVLLASLRNSARVAIPLTGFLGLALAVANFISVWFDEERAWHWAAGFAFAGFNNRIMMGPRAQLVAGVLGGTLGFAGGLVKSIGYQSYPELTMRNYRYWRHVREVMLEMYGEGKISQNPSNYKLFHQMPPVY